jgi:hypothetical protein
VTNGVTSPDVLVETAIVAGVVLPGIEGVFSGVVATTLGITAGWVATARDVGVAVTCEIVDVI